MGTARSSLTNRAGVNHVLGSQLSINAAVVDRGLLSRGSLIIRVKMTILAQGYHCALRGRNSTRSLTV